MGGTAARPSPARPIQSHGDWPRAPRLYCRGALSPHTPLAEAEPVSAVQGPLSSRHRSLTFTLLLASFWQN